MPSAVCPECHTHHPTMPDGRLAEHLVTDRLFGADAHGGLPDGVGARTLDGCTWPAQMCPGHETDSHGAWTKHRCPGSEDWPNRALGNSRYDVTSNFASCPASTGESKCTDFPDRAHRCGEARDHYQTDTRPGDKRTHKCTCGAQWTALMGSVGQLFETMLKPSETLTTQLIMEYAGNDRAVTLLRYALHLRMYGENAPGGNETWREFDTRAEAFLRHHGAPLADHRFDAERPDMPCQMIVRGIDPANACGRPRSEHGSGVWDKADANGPGYPCEGAEMGVCGGAPHTEACPSSDQAGS